MKVQPLTESQSWKGTFYPKGSTEIPDDLAEALGLKAKEPIAPPEPVTGNVTSEESEEPTKHRRKRGEGG